jgi:hypothetical protein
VTKQPADDDVVTVDEPTYVETVDTADGTVSDRHRVVDGVSDDDAREVHAREKAAFGGMKFGSAFFGWLTALGVGVLLTSTVAAIGTAMGMSTDDAVVSARALGIFGLVAVAVIMFVAYLAGGYVAGRMARFSGARQGLAVWLWAVIAAIVLGVLGVVLGARFDVLANLDAFPRLPLTGDDLNLAGVITALVFAAISLVGAILGGLAGMRYHRRVDRAGTVD